jgi:hypothetical protein
VRKHSGHTVRAGFSIGSGYQFFNTKSAPLSTLGPVFRGDVTAMRDREMYEMLLAGLGIVGVTARWRTPQRRSPVTTPCARQ